MVRLVTKLVTLLFAKPLYTRTRRGVIPSYTVRGRMGPLALVFKTSVT